MIEKNRISEIVTLHSEICGLLKTSVDKAIRIGELLNELKGSLKHGEFIPWIKANLPFTERTAQNYMRLYDSRERLKNENVSYLADAYKLLSGNTETPQDWQEYIRSCLREIKERLASLDNIEPIESRIIECKLLMDILRELTQSCAEILLYAESHVEELIDREGTDHDYR